MKFKLILMITLLIFTSHNCYAEYYLVYSVFEPLPTCTPCYGKYDRARKASSMTSSHKGGRYKIEMYYVYDPYAVYPCRAAPPCCYEKVKTSKRNRSKDYIDFNYDSTSYYKTTERATEYDSYDMRTADDNVMRYPDVNNQY